MAFLGGSVSTKGKAGEDIEIDQNQGKVYPCCLNILVDLEIQEPAKENKQEHHDVNPETLKNSEIVQELVMCFEDKVQTSATDVPYHAIKVGKGNVWLLHFDNESLANGKYFDCYTTYEFLCLI